MDPAPSPGFRIHGHIQKITLIFHCEATFFFGTWLGTFTTRPKKNTLHGFSAFPSTAASWAGLRLIPPEKPCCSCLATGQPATALLTLV